MDSPDDTIPESFVNALGGVLVDASGQPVQGRSAAERAERLAALRRQRMLLADLRDEAGSAVRGFPVDDDSGWVSEAQRQYSARRAELRLELVLAVRALDEALAGVTEAIATLSEGG